MAATEAQNRATRKYKAKAYDRLEVIVPKGDREKIREAAVAAGQSVNAYINQAVRARMAQEASRSVAKGKIVDFSAPPC